MWSYQDFSYNPELDHAIPRELQEATYKEWSSDPTKKNMTKLVDTFAKLINSEVGKYQGTLDREMLYNYAKKYVADAVHSYNPKTGNQLSTHIVNNLQRLHRLNYQNVQGLRAPEEIQTKIRPYLDTKTYMEETLGREPTDEELSEEIGYDVKKIKKYLKYEQGPQDLLHAHQYTETSPEEEMLDLLYYDLPDTHKRVLEYKTGYNNSQVLSGREIAKKLKISPVRVSQISDQIGKQLIGALYAS